MIRAVVFDFDGVIANSEPLHFRAFRDVLLDEGVELTEEDYYGRYLGFDDVGAFRAIAADQGRSWSAHELEGLVAKKAARMEALEGTESVLFPGARDAIGRLAEAYPLAIASGALRGEIERVLRHEALAGYFHVIVAAEDTAASKPAPDPYLHAVERLSAAMGARLSAAECVAIEDSAWGLESARTAGLRTIAVTHTYPADQLKAADLVVQHLDALTSDLLARSLR